MSQPCFEHCARNAPIIEGKIMFSVILSQRWIASNIGERKATIWIRMKAAAAAQFRKGEGKAKTKWQRERGETERRERLKRGRREGE